VADYLGATAFPERRDLDETQQRWRPSDELDQLIVEIMQWARPRLEQAASVGDSRRQRVWWWSMLGLVRALGSSPTAAAASVYSR
jgi:hypothetical protein